MTSCRDWPSMTVPQAGVLAGITQAPTTTAADAIERIRKRIQESLSANSQFLDTKEVPHHSCVWLHAYIGAFAAKSYLHLKRIVIATE